MQLVSDIRYLLFTSPFCSACKPVKEFLAGAGLTGQDIDASCDEGGDIAVRFSVMKLPTVIFLDSEGQEISRCHSVSEIREFLD